jgi:hypothetical protein
MLVLLGLLPAGSSQANETSETNYTLFVAINSSPPGVLLTTPADLSGKGIGVTPFVLVLNVSWERNWNGMHWRRIHVQSPGNACRAEFDARGTCHLVLNFTASKPGFKTQHFEVEAAALPPPGFFWSGRDDWPLKSSLQIELEKSESESAPAVQEEKASTVVIAKNETSKDMSRILVTSPESNAEIFLNDQRVGMAPLNLLLQPGTYRLQVRKQGFAPFQKEIVIQGNTEERLDAVLSPLPQE